MVQHWWWLGDGLLDSLAFTCDDNMNNFAKNCMNLKGGWEGGLSLAPPLGSANDYGFTKTMGNENFKLYISIHRGCWKIKLYTKACFDGLMELSFFSHIPSPPKIELCITWALCLWWIAPSSRDTRPWRSSRWPSPSWCHWPLCWTSGRRKTCESGWAVLWGHQNRWTDPGPGKWRT